MKFSSTARMGLIPAHAGKTHDAILNQIYAQAHPRACGENGEFLGEAFEEEGSSPRMRGKQNFIRRASTEIGLIPAHAGKTDDEVGVPLVEGAHPRACGENNIPRN